MKLRTGQQNLFSLNNRRKRDWEKNEQNLRDLWDNNKRSNIYISGVPEGEEKKEWGQKGIQGNTVMKKIFGKQQQKALYIQGAQ